jgi:hypothetical protein
MALYNLSINNLALVAATAKSVVEIGTPSTVRAKIVQWWAEFDGVSASAVPVKIELGRFSSGVTTATTLAGFALDANEPASLVTAKHSTTTEGAGTISGGEIHLVSPTSGILVQYPLGREWMIGASGFWRMRLTAPAAVNVTFGVQWEE